MTPRMRWVVLLYFIQGLPFGWFNDALPVYFRMHGVSLANIGLVGLLSAPWSFKFLWSPLVDRALAPRWWIAGALLVMAAATALVQPETGLPLAVALFV